MGRSVRRAERGRAAPAGGAGGGAGWCGGGRGGGGWGGGGVVDVVPPPADGIAAVEQGGRAAYHFQALDAVGVFRHRVVVGQRRGVERTDAVAQQADAITVHAADHRSAGARSEVGGGHPGQAVEGFAEAAFLSQGQLVAFEHAAGRGGRFVAQRVGGDHLGGQFAGAAVGAERFPRNDQAGQRQWRERPERTGREKAGRGHCGLHGHGSDFFQAKANPGPSRRKGDGVGSAYLLGCYIISFCVGRPA